MIEVQVVKERGCLRIISNQVEVLPTTSKSDMIAVSLPLATRVVEVSLVYHLIKFNDCRPTTTCYIIGTMTLI